MIKNKTKVKLYVLTALAGLFMLPGSAAAGFEERFEDSNFARRGWYDNTTPALSSTHVAPGSTRSVAFRFPVGAKTPVNGRSMRRKFSESESVYVRYYVRYSSNWQGSNRNYHPHEFYLLTNIDTDWIGPAYSHLTAYIEQNALRPHLAIQDGRNVDLNSIGRNLVGVTENRSVAGCNGDSDGHGNGSCYRAGSGYWNGKHWMADKSNIRPGQWHKVEAYFRLNSISNGKGVADGVMRYWLDGELIMDYNNIMFRTGRHPNMKFNQFIIGPWIGDGSPVDQTFWVDNLLVAHDVPASPPPVVLERPSNLRIITVN